MIVLGMVDVMLLCMDLISIGVLIFLRVEARRNFPCRTAHVAASRAVLDIIQFRTSFVLVSYISHTHYVCTR